MDRLEKMFVDICDSLYEDYELTEKDKDNLGLYLADARKVCRNLVRICCKYNGEEYDIEKFLFPRKYALICLDRFVFPKEDLRELEDDMIEAIEENPDAYIKFATNILYWARSKQLSDEFDECTEVINEREGIESREFVDMKFNFIDRIVKRELKNK